MVSALATIITFSTALVCRAQRLSSDAQSVQGAERDAWRLSADLRGAARVATGVQADNDTLTFLYADGIEHAFRFTQEGVSTEQRRDKERFSGDTYRLRGRPAWEIRFDRVSRLLEIEARYPSETERARHGATAFHVVATAPRFQPEAEAPR